MNLQRLYRYHRILGLCTALPLIMWALSGMLHPFAANWFRPKIARSFISETYSSKEFSNEAFLRVVEEYQSSEVRNVRPVRYEGKVFLQVESLTGELRYFDSRNGTELLNGDRVYAEYLARTLLSDWDSSILENEIVTDFTIQYRYINRFLPVHRIRFDNDGTYDVYVETKSDRLAAFSTVGTRFYLSAFAYLHNWSFLGSKDSALRKGVMFSFLFCGLLVGLGGVVLYGPFRKRTFINSPVSFWHRNLGLISSVALGAFGISGIWMLLDPGNGEPSYLLRKEQRLPLSKSLIGPSQALQVVNGAAKTFYFVVLGGSPYYMVELADKKDTAELLIDAHAGTLRHEGAEEYARFLAHSFSGYPDSSIKAIERISAFGDDYPFIMKRLPVYRVKYSGQEYLAYTVEPSSGYLSVRTKLVDIFRTLTFLHLHKYHFLESAGKNVRDGVSVLMTLLISLTALFGLLLYGRRMIRK